MNDPRSTLIGWSALILAAGAGYYLARKDLNERRREQTRQGLRGPAKDWREKIAESTEGSTSASGSGGSLPASGSLNPPSCDASATATSLPSEKPLPKVPPDT